MIDAVNMYDTQPISKQYTQIYTIAIGNMHIFSDANLRETVILYASIHISVQMVYMHRYTGYTQMIYTVNMHDTQSKRKCCAQK